MNRIIVITLLITMILISACQAQVPIDVGQQITPVLSEENSLTDSITIRIVVLPIIDTLPMYVAEQEGLYTKLGINVEFIPVASAPERDQILQAGQADATVNEILSDMFFNKNGIRMQVVRYALLASQKAPHFFILTSADSGIRSIEDLKNVEIGISDGTIIEYVTDRLLEAQGFTSDEIKTISVPKMPDRMALLASGELKAGVLPDPLAALSVQQGANIILDDTQFPAYGASVISFRKEFIDQNPKAVNAFLAAIEEATIMLNSNPGNYVNLLSEKQLVPSPLLSTYNVPEFPLEGITSEKEWNDALSWATEKGLISVNIPYRDSVNSDYLP